MTTMDRTIERRDTTGEPRTASSARRPAIAHRVLAVLALLGGVLAAMSGTPYRAQPVGALELALWIHDHKPGLRIVDVRDAAAFADYHVPRSERVSGPLTAREGETLVIIDDVRTTNNEQRSTDNGPRRATSDPRTAISDQRPAIRDQRPAISDQRPAISNLRGRNIYYLRGGVGEWLAEVMSPTQPSELTRYFGGQPRAGSGAPPAVHTIRRRGC
jgi:rhodanese-related sulfurtransferase